MDTYHFVEDHKLRLYIFCTPSLSAPSLPPPLSLEALSTPLLNSTLSVVKFAKPYLSESVLYLAYEIYETLYIQNMNP